MLRGQNHITEDIGNPRQPQYAQCRLAKRGIKAPTNHIVNSTQISPGCQCNRVAISIMMASRHCARVKARRCRHEPYTQRASTSLLRRRPWNDKLGCWGVRNTIDVTRVKVITLSLHNDQVTPGRIITVMNRY